MSVFETDVEKQVREDQEEVEEVAEVEEDLQYAFTDAPEGEVFSLEDKDGEEEDEEVA